MVGGRYPGLIGGFVIGEAVLCGYFPPFFLLHVDQ